MRMIDADALMVGIKENNLGEWYVGRIDGKSEEVIPTDTVYNIIDSALSIDIVRCQDCKYWVYNFNGCARNPCTEPWYALDFCNYGEREGK